MEKHKIIHVLYAGLGGHANVVFPLLESDFGLNHEHVLVFFGVEDVLPAYLKRCKDLGLTHYNIKKKPRRYLKAFNQFKKILNTIQPSRIIVHSSELIIPAVNYSKKTGSKSFYVEHENNLTKGRSLNFFSRFALRHSDGVVCLNEGYKNELIRKFKVVAPIYIIPNGINTNRFKVGRPNHENIVLGMASRMIPGKDHRLLIGAFEQVLKKYSNLKLLIAGDGETFEEIQALISEKKLTNSISLLGLLNEDQMIDFYRKIHLFVLATRSETLSTAILQAMSSELPVISSDIENNIEILHSEKIGWVYKNNDMNDLANKIIFAINNRDNWGEIGQKAREDVIKKYSLRAMSNNYTRLIK